MLEKRAAAVRTGGKGSVRRTVKAPHKSSGDDKKVQGTLKKLGVSPIEVDGATFIRENGTGMIFNKPKVQASMQNQCFVVSGPYDTKTAQEMLPIVLSDVAKAQASITPNPPQEAS